jgi:hypothetical protein
LFRNDISLNIKRKRDKLESKDEFGQIFKDKNLNHQNLKLDQLIKTDCSNLNNEN